MNNYFLGYFVNENGVTYAKVYSDNMPDNEKQKFLATYNSHISDIYDQIYFCSVEYFEQCKQNGWAI